MKDWAHDHPKAKLMARKRAAILAAARDAFLSFGYEGVTMEAIAAAADVSIMTLYRHAKSKDELFAAVISGACDQSDEAEQAEMAAMMKEPLEEILAWGGGTFQDRLASPETAALLQTVVAGSSRFPQLAQAAYEGLVGHVEGMAAKVLAEKEETSSLGEATRMQLSKTFVDRLFGADILLVVLGLGVASPAERRKRAARAAAETMADVALALREADIQQRKKVDR